MTRARILLGLATLSVLAVACADLFDFKDLHEAEASVPDVNVPDVNVPDVAPDVDTCQHARWPGVPTTDGSTGTPANYTLAMRHVYFTTTPDGGVASFGYDLDSRCTTDQTNASCKAQSATIDGVGGVDNESIALMNTVLSLGVTSSLSDQSINNIIAAGSFSILLRVFGLQNDQNQPPSQTLKIAVQATSGLVTAPPTWDGGDRWYPSADDVVGGLNGTNTPNRLISAYVANGTLVATDPNPVAITLYLPPGNTLAGPLHVKLNQPVLTAKLAKRSDGNYDITSGIIAGRWSANDMLAEVANLTINNTSLCSYLNGTAFGLVAQQVCGARDITSAGPDDDTAACDALSVAVAFDAVSAQVSSSPVTFPTSSTPCADAGLCGD